MKYIPFIPLIAVLYCLIRTFYYIYLLLFGPKDLDIQIATLQTGMYWLMWFWGFVIVLRLTVYFTIK